jgi:RNA recognition motif-containing protein
MSESHGKDETINYKLNIPLDDVIKLEHDRSKGDSSKRSSSKEKSSKGDDNNNTKQGGSKARGEDRGDRDRDRGGDDDKNKDCRVFVGSLNFKTSWQTLKDHMRTAGEVVRADIFQTPDGRSKGCGVVEYAVLSEAQKAIKQLHGTRLDGREINVREV